MNNKEKIIRYLDNQLSQKEKELFEKELSASAELKTELESFLKVKNAVKSAKDLKLDENYLSSIVPRFQEKLEKKKKFAVYKNLGYAFSFALVFFISFMIYNPFGNENENDLEEFAQSLTETEKLEVLGYINGHNDLENYADLSVIDSQFGLENVIKNITNKSELSSYYDLEVEKLSENISSEELDQIYNEILNKKF